MNKTVVTGSEPHPRSHIFLLAALIIAALVGLAWILAESEPPRSVAGEVAPPQVTELRAPDAYTIQLDQLRRGAASVAARDSATAYGVSLEALARAGRQASLDSRLPATANGYSTYLDNLRRLGQAAASEDRLPADPNAYSEWLDQLRRMSQAAK